MSAITTEMEMELENELAPGAAEMEMETPAPEMETGYESEQEAEMEQESFFNHLAAMADRGGRSQALRRIGLAAARQALRGQAARPAPAVEGESEFESEALESEMEVSPLHAAQANAMMEHLSHAAAAAENEQEAAEHFLPLIPLAAKAVLPLAAKIGAKALPRLARKVTPHLTRGLGHVARTLFRSKTTRPLLRTMPHIAKRTVASLARHVARGGHVTPHKAVRTLAHHTARVVGSPRHAVRAFRRSGLLDRRYHTAARKAVGRPPARVWRQLYRGWHPAIRRTPARPVYNRPRGYYASKPVTRSTYGHAVRYPAPVAAHATLAPVGQCLCFQPVSCASCSGACPTHR